MPIFQRASSAAVGSFTRVFLDRPWRAKSVRAAALITLLGMAFWLKGAFQGDTAKPSDPPPPGATQPSGGWNFSKPIPGYVRLCVSYIGGFLLGWTFRRFVAVTFLITLFLVGLLGFGKYSGCDSSGLRERIGKQVHAARETAEHERDYLRGFLPSGTAAGLGVFWGFWRRSRGVPGPTVVPDVAGGNPPSETNLPPRI